jgi:hypothetical protein
MATSYVLNEKIEQLRHTAAIVAGPAKEVETDEGRTGLRAGQSQAQGKESYQTRQEIEYPGQGQ